MRSSLARHDSLIEELVAAHRGIVVHARGEGDSRFAVFSRATDAVAAAAGIQRGLHTEAWPMPAALKVRVALHSGEADLREGSYYGAAVNRCTRLRDVGYGGQVVLSQAVRGLVYQTLPADLALRDLGEHRLRDLAAPEHVYQLLPLGVPVDFPPIKALAVISHNLPMLLTSFIGRGQEVTDVKKLLESSRLLTLTGPGASGKTRLALRLAADLVGDYPHGVYLVSLPRYATLCLSRRRSPRRWVCPRSRAAFWRIV